jgi:hypothetical protein
MPGSIGLHDLTFFPLKDNPFCLFGLHRELEKGTNLFFRLALVRSRTIKNGSSRSIPQYELEFER